MRRKSFGTMTCPIARGLERVGEWWSILILRDVLAGKTRFEQLQDNLGIAPGMLTRRLNALVKTGLLMRQRYQTRPSRYEYVATARAEDFRPVLITLMTWGNKHFAVDGPRVAIADRRTGKIADPVLVDRKTGKPLSRETHAFVATRGGGKSISPS